MLTNLLDAWNVRLLERDDSDSALQFHPTYCYSIFPGVEEQLEVETASGYKDLRLVSHYASGSLKMYFELSFAERAPNAQPENIMAALQPWWPEIGEGWRADSMEDLLQHVRKENVRWRPPGRQIASYETNGERYELWHGKFDDEAMREYHQRLRVFMVLLVDGARYLDDEDDKWDVFVLFRVSKLDGVYCFAGFFTCYPFFSWKGSGDGKLRKKLDAERMAAAAEAEGLVDRLERTTSQGITVHVSPSVEEVVQSIVTHGYASQSSKLPWYQRRFRIGQFLILPPFQRKGHGFRVMELLYEFAATQYAPLRDISVEDPSPDFVALRDCTDLAIVMQAGLVSPMQAVNDAAIEAHLTSKHICKQQIERILDILHWAEATHQGQQAMQNLEDLIKKKLYKRHAADIPDNDENEKNETIQQLWIQERDAFENILRKQRLIAGEKK